MKHLLTISLTYGAILMIAGIVLYLAITNFADFIAWTVFACLGFLVFIDDANKFFQRFKYTVPEMDEAERKAIRAKLLEKIRKDNKRCAVTVSKRCFVSAEGEVFEVIKEGN